MKTTPSQLMVGLSLLAVISASAFASDPTPVSASSASSSPVSQEAIKAFSYRSRSDAAEVDPVVAPTVALTGEYADVSKNAPVKMERVQVKDQVSPERQFRAVSEAMAFSDPTAPCALYTKEVRHLPHHMLFEAFCGPIFPTLGESATLGEQPRFPLVGLNW